MQIIFEDNHLIAVNKTNNEIVQVDKTGDVSLEMAIKDYLKKKYNKSGEAYLGVSHRLDRPVSGIVIFAKTSKSLTRMNNMFREGKVKKIYWAIIKNKPPSDSGTLINYLRRNEKENKTYCYEKEIKNSKQAILDYKILASSERYYLLEINLKTGRHHQIRAQLAHIGCPIKGDLKYGFPRSNEHGGISLHARQVEFEHPVKKDMIKLVCDPAENDNLWKHFIDDL